MSKVSEVKDYNLEYKKDLKKVSKLYARRKLLRATDYPFNVSVKLQILLTSSFLKLECLGTDLLEIVKQERFFVSMAILRMMFEELIALTFVLWKLQQIDSREDAEKVLEKATIGRRTAKPALPSFNIMTMGKGAEEYITNNYPQLAGMYNDTYEFLSEYVHPNGPSRHHFWERDENAIYFKQPPFAGEDKDMILNYGCMTLNMYALIYTSLRKVKLPS
ncbi:MAG: hypothetical protein ABIP54_01095 [Candidatus Andersenbacteria bacterium]